MRESILHKKCLVLEDRLFGHKEPKQSKMLVGLLDFPVPDVIEEIARIFILIPQSSLLHIVSIGTVVIGLVLFGIWHNILELVFK